MQADQSAESVACHICGREIPHDEYRWLDYLAKVVTCERHPPMDPTKVRPIKPGKDTRKPGGE